MSGQAVRALVARERSALARVHALAALAAGTAVLFAAVALAAVALGAGRWLAAPRWVPMAAAVVAVGAALLVGARGAHRVRRDASLDCVIADIERERTLRAGSLRAGLELEGSGPLAAAGVETLRRQLGEGALAARPRRLARRLALRSGAVAVVAGAALLLLAPSHGDGLRAVMLPIMAWRGELLPAMQLLDVPSTVARGREFRVRVDAAGRRRVTLRERETGAAWRTRAIALDDDGVAVVTVGPISADVHLALSDGRAESDEVVVRASDRAYLGGVVVRAVLPAYLGGGSERMAADEPIRVPRGTRLEISGHATVEPASVRLAGARDTLTLAANGQRFGGTLAAERDGRWEWLARARDGTDLDRPVPLEIFVAPDSAPHIEIAAPAGDTVVVSDPQVAIRLVASDDHGLAVVRLVSATASGSPRARELSRDLPGRWAADAALDVSALGVQPGGLLRVTAEAVDNSPWAQRAQSRTLVLRVPGLAEQRELARAAADSLARAAATAVAAQRELSRRTGEAARSRGDRGASTSGSSSAARGEDAMSYAAAQQSGALRAQQQDLASRVEKLRDQARSLERTLDRAGALDSALASRLADTQRLLAEALTPELRAALSALDSALASQSGERTRESLGDLAREQEKLRAQLERVAEMLARAALEGSLETLRDEASDLATAERRLADSARTARPADARRLAQRAAALSRDAKVLGDRLRKSGGETGARHASQASQQSALSADEMREAAQGGTVDDANAREGAEQMEAAASSLAKAREEQVGAWKAELAAELDRSIQELLQLAGEQRELEAKSRAGTAPGELRGEQSALQQGVERTSERIERAARASAHVSGGARRSVSEARRETARATEESTRPGSRGTNTANAMGSAADALTRAASALVRDRERVNASGSATGFAEMMREMQDLARKQGSINGQSAGLFQMQQGQSGEGREAARAMARAQRQVGRSLDELGDADGSGRAEALAAEAKRIADALERGDLTAATRDRQEKLFRRMLDAGRSLQGEERDDDAKRDATSAAGVQLFTPPAGSAQGAAANRYREPTWEELRGLSAEERRAVIDYFRRLNGTGRDR